MLTLASKILTPPCLCENPQSQPVSQSPRQTCVFYPVRIMWLFPTDQTHTEQVGDKAMTPGPSDWPHTAWVPRALRPRRAGNTHGVLPGLAVLNESRDTCVVRCVSADVNCVALAGINFCLVEQWQTQKENNRDRAGLTLRERGMEREIERQRQKGLEGEREWRERHTERQSRTERASSFRMLSRPQHFLIETWCFCAERRAPQ